MSGRAARDAAEPPLAGFSVAGLHFGYPEADLFRGIDLVIRTGEMVALLGPNGSGKTTLLKLLSGALKPDAGRVMIAGRPLERLRPRQRGRLIGVVPQDTSATFDFTVMETVLMGRTPYLGLFSLEGPEDIHAAQEALLCTGMLPFSGRLLSNLSGGERQLAFIARALAQQPKLLLLDEPTAFLDIRHRLEIYDRLSDLNRSRGLTILTTSHDINLAARYCPRIVLMKNGRIRADGTAKEVIRAELLQEVFEAPLRVLEDPSTGMPYATPGGPDSDTPG
ncbi:MAG: ABC transporter ATP-binding protein [Acidobacteriota bacterium]